MDKVQDKVKEAKVEVENVWNSWKNRAQKVYPFSPALPPFDLSGKRKKNLSEYESLGRPINELLYKHFRDNAKLSFKLAPEDSLDLNVSFWGDHSSPTGKATATYISDSLYFRGKLSTSQIGKASATIKHFKTHHNSSFSIFGGFISSLTPNVGRTTGISPSGAAALERAGQGATSIFPNFAAYDTTVFIGGGASNERFAFEGSVGSDLKAKAWGVVKSSRVTIGSEICHDLRCTDPQKATNVQFIASYRNQIPKNNVPVTIASNLKPAPDFFDLTVKVEDWGQSFDASYVQHILMPSQTTNQRHHVSLGGQFKHSQKKPLATDATNVLTVGGSWQLSDTAIVKAKVDTTANFDLLAGFKFGYFPLLTLTANIGGNAVKSTAWAGVSILLED